MLHHFLGTMYSEWLQVTGSIATGRYTLDLAQMWLKAHRLLGSFKSAPYFQYMFYNTVYV